MAIETHGRFPLTSIYIVQIYFGGFRVFIQPGVFQIVFDSEWLCLYERLKDSHEKMGSLK